MTRDESGPDSVQRSSGETDPVDNRHAEILQMIVRFGHFGGIGLNLMTAIPAPGEAVRLAEGEAPRRGGTTRLG